MDCRTPNMPVKREETAREETPKLLKCKKAEDSWQGADDIDVVPRDTEEIVKVVGSSTGKIFGVPVHIKKETVDVPDEVLHVMKEFVGHQVPPIWKEILEEILDVLPQRFSERTGAD